MRSGDCVQPACDPRRPRRVGQLLALVWALSLIDLAFTLWAHFFTEFQEMNPIASAMLRHGLLASLVLYKLLATSVGSIILWRLRHHRAAELAMWLLAVLYMLLMGRWASYTSEWVAVAAM